MSGNLLPTAWAHFSKVVGTGLALEHLDILRSAASLARSGKDENMPLPEFSPVRLTTDRYISKGVRRGAIGFILDVYDDGYEVEFSRPDGTTIAWFAVKPDDIEPAPEILGVPSDRSMV